jgi:hypothetical protein
MRSVVFALLAALSLAACIDSAPADPEDGSGYEGVDEDNDPNTVMDDGKSDAPRYAIPTDLPELVAPEVIVSLDGLSIHLFDRNTGFSEVYPTGVGEKDSHGESYTPAGHFKTGPDNTDTWWYVARRTNPAYFGGLPFLRLTIENSQGSNTYAFHGPITATLQRGFVSHGCMRMRANDIIRLFYIAKAHPDMPVSIQTEVEHDADGAKVDVGMTPALYPVDEPLPFPDSIGPRPW